MFLTAGHEEWRCHCGIRLDETCALSWVGSAVLGLARRLLEGGSESRKGQDVSNLSKRIDARFLAAAAVVGAGAGMAEQANAAIVWSGVVNLNIPSSTNGLYLNVVTGANNLPAPGTAGTTVPGWDINPWSSTGFSLFSPAGLPSSVNGASTAAYVRTSATGGNNLPGGTVIDGNSFYGTGTTTWSLNSSSNIFGFRFRNEANSQIHYGWARVSLAGTLQGQPRSLVEYAYEDQPGVAIAAGAIPAPGSLALLGLGAAGLVSRRRK